MKENIFSKDELYTVETNGYSSDGAAVARLNGYIIFVKGGISGEKYNVRLTDISKTYSKAEIVEILKSSENRIASDCSSYPECGGCCLRHMTYDEELEVKRQKVNNALKRLGDINIEIDHVNPSPKLTEYRNNVQFKVQTTGSKTVFGFYKNSSHTVVPCDSCRIQPVEANKIASVLCEKISDPLEEIIIRKAEYTGEILCGIKCKNTPEIKYFIDILREFVPKIKGIVLYNDRNSGKYSEKVLWGRNYIEDTLCGRKFRITCRTFYQINPLQTENLYGKAIEYALDGKETIGKALDLYCGIGTIGISASKYAESIVGIEIVKESIENAKRNAIINNLENTSFFCGDAKEQVEKLKKSGYSPDVIFTDPPRSGMDDKTIDIITGMSPYRIVYVSCDPATMSRDLKKMSAKGYEVKKISAFDMFPRTEHVETVCILSKRFI